MLRGVVVRSAAVLVGLVALAITGCSTSAAPEPDRTTSATAEPADGGDGVGSTALGASGDGSFPPSTEDAGTAEAPEFPVPCRELVDPVTYEATFGDIPLNHPDRSDAPTDGIRDFGLDTDLPIIGRLSCFWTEPDPAATRGLHLSAGNIDPTIVEQVIADHEYTSGTPCEARYGGRWCQTSSASAGNGQGSAVTSFYRDDIYIKIDQSDFPTNGLLAAVVDRIWGD